MKTGDIKFWTWYYGRRTVDYYHKINKRLSDYKKYHPVKHRLYWLSSAALTLTAAGSIVLLTMAQGAFKEFNENVLHKQQLAVTFYDKNGDLVGRRGIKLDDSMQLSDYPPYFIDAVLATEDRRFYSHLGIDPIGTARAMVNNSKGGHKQGGSSITQQLAKNLFLSNERTFERKVKELFLAFALEWNFTKEEILKLYLDRAYMGGGAYGAAEASRHYFNKSAKDLSVSEAAILAGLFKAPSKFSPEANAEESRKRWLTVLDNLKTTKKITDEQYSEALLYPPQTNIYKDNTAANYFLDWAWEEIKQLEADNKLGSEKVLKVYTTLDLKLQRRTEELITKQLEEAEDRFEVEQTAVVVMAPDGAVLSMIGGSDYRESAFNRVTKAQRQPGSSFKTFVYAAALDAGILDKDTVVTDRPTCIGNWCPNNYNRGYAGAMPAWQALAQSINTIPVQLSIQLGKEESSVKAGRAKIIDMAYKMGVKSPMYDAQSLPIGSVEVTPLDMAVGYATIASGGYRAEAHSVITVRNTAGDLIYQRQDNREKVLSDKVVSNLNFMLHRVVEMGTGGAVKTPNVAIAGKTGTTNAYKDAWFVGYTGSVVAAVWMGNDNNVSSARMTGGSLPARTWKIVMDDTLKQPQKALLGVNFTPPKPAAPKKQGQPMNITQPVVPQGPTKFEPPVQKERNFFQNLFNMD